MKKFLSLFAFFALMSSMAAYGATEIDRIIAIVGQQVVTLSELQGEMAPAMRDISQRYRGDELATATDRLKRSTLNSLIDKYLQLQEARVQGVEVSDEEVNSAIADIMTKNNLDRKAFEDALAGEGYTYNDYKKVLTDQLTILRLVTREIKSRVSIKEEDIVAAYNKDKARYSQPETIKVANISFPAPEGDMDKALKNAQDARAQILAGTPFEEMAAKCSGDPKAAKTCVLGTFSRGELSQAVEQQAFKLSTGDISEPIKNEKGYQLIKMMERSQPGAKSLEEARPQIVDELSSRQGEALFATWLQDLRKHTYVEIRGLDF